MCGKFDIRRQIQSVKTGLEIYLFTHQASGHKAALDFSQNLYAEYKFYHTVQVKFKIDYKIVSYVVAIYTFLVKIYN